MTFYGPAGGQLDYTLFVQAERSGGNQTGKKRIVRVNRSGSFIRFLQGQPESVRPTTIRNAENLEVTERNRDQLSKKAIVCVKDGSFRILQEGGITRPQFRR